MVPGKEIDRNLIILIFFFLIQEYIHIHIDI